MGVCRRTQYRWKKALTDTGDLAALAIRSSAPKRCRTPKTDPRLVAEIRRFRTQPWKCLAVDTIECVRRLNRYLVTFINPASRLAFAVVLPSKDTSHAQTARPSAKGGGHVQLPRSQTSARGSEKTRCERKNTQSWPCSRPRIRHFFRGGIMPAGDTSS